MQERINVFWFRRDLRLHDNQGLRSALAAGLPVQAVFIFDKQILDKLPKQDKRLNFIHQRLQKISEQLQQLGASLLVAYGHPTEIWAQWAQTLPIHSVYTNRDYEAYPLERDEAVQKLLAARQIGFFSDKDQVIFEKKEVVKADGSPYVVFSPYSRAWLAKLEQQKDENGRLKLLQSAGSELLLANFRRSEPQPLPSLEQMGFETLSEQFADFQPNLQTIRAYEQQRDFPAAEGTTRAGLYLRFGAVSVRELARLGAELSDTFLNEIIWRDFYSQILANFPHVQGRPFRLEYEAIGWRDSEQDFERWKLGKTGYPLVDAGMRELNATGFMHNRVRMVVASFLVKHLLIDWRRGEAYFAEKLLDFDLASNSGGWQWAAGCGTDAAPYFRIFNPQSQLEKFDKQLKYVKKWVPEYGSNRYVSPMVEHTFARNRCLDVYKKALKAEPEQPDLFSGLG